MSEDGIDGSAISTPPEEASSLRMVATLGAAGALAGLLIVGVFTVTLPLSRPTRPKSFASRSAKS